MSQKIAGAVGVFVLSFISLVLIYVLTGGSMVMLVIGGISIVIAMLSLVLINQQRILEHQSRERKRILHAMNEHTMSKRPIFRENE